MATKGANRLRSVTHLGQYIDQFYEDLRNAPQNGKAVAWCDGFPLPFPILRAMDISYLYGDAYAASTSARHQEKRLQQIADDAGYLIDVCSYTRTTMGCAVMSDEERATAHPQHQMPKPDMIIVADPGCSMLVNWADSERRHFKMPMFVIQIPHLWRGEADEQAAVADTARQLSEMITFIEDLLHRKLDWDRLREIMVGVKEAIICRNEALAMSKYIPAPATFFDLASALGGVNYLLGRAECVEVYRNMRDEMADRVATKTGAVLDEKYRLYWDGIMCWPKLGHLAQKFANWNACVVAGRYTHFGFYNKPELIDPAKPLESLAANAVALHGNQNLDWLIENISQLCTDFALDGLIMHAHRTCRPLAGPQLEVMDGVSRRLGIPGVFLEADMADDTYYSDAQVDTRVQGLLESIAAKKRRG